MTVLKLELDQEINQRLTHLCAITDTPSKAKLISKALALFDYLLMQEIAGSTIRLIKANGVEDLKIRS